MKISQAIRNDFPILRRKINGKQLVYLDSAATSQKPKQVVKATADFYFKHNANTHRGVHQLAEEATEMYELARQKTADFIGAKSAEEIIFTRGATEAINLLARSWGEKNIKRGNNIITTIMEHHSNFVPWQELCKRKKAQLRAAPITKDGRLELKKFYSLIDKKTKLIAIAHASNVLGTINPMAEISRCLKSIISNLKPKLFVDGAQAIPHMPINVQKLGCDSYAFSGHKMLGPTGVGVLYARKEILEEMTPFLFGGHMIRKVSSKKAAEWNDIPWRFEAGTASIAQVIGLGAAMDYLRKIGMKRIAECEHSLTLYALNKMKNIKGMEIYGPQTANERAGVISFNISGVHPHDLATLLDQKGIAVRAGHQCAMPLHREALGIEASARASFYFYNTKDEIDKLVSALKSIQKMFNLGL